MYKNLNNYIEKLGLNPSKLTVMNKIALITHLIPALIKDGHAISVGLPQICKTTTINKSSSKVKEITKFSSAEIFGNKVTKQNGIISNDYNIAYTEQISTLKDIDSEACQGLLTHCNGGDYKRASDETFQNRTSFVLLGNIKENIENDMSIDYKTDFLEVLPDEIKKRQGLERFIILPSFLMRKITREIILENKDDNNLRDELDSNRREAKDYNLDSKNEIRNHKEKCKIIEALNYFLNNDDISISPEVLSGFSRVADSIVNLKIKSYESFFYKNEEGRKLALTLIKEYFPKDYTLEEAHFFKERALIKFKEEDLWWKIAISNKGVIENRNEFNIFKQIENKDFVAEIIDIKNNDMILLQKYYPIFSEYLKVRNLDIDEKKQYEKLEQNYFELKEKIFSLETIINQLIQTFLIIENKLAHNKIIPQVIIPSLKDNEALKETLYTELNKKFSVNIRKSDIGIADNKLILLNFHHLHNLK